MSDIFISYKREEQAIARNVANALEQHGWSVWWDPKLRAGERFDDVIEAALEEAKCVIVMWSRLSVTSRYVKDEATYALDDNKLVPVTIEEVKLPIRFRNIHTSQLTGWDGSEVAVEFCRLVEDISALIGPPAKRSGRNKPSQKPEQVQKPASQSEKKPVATSLVVNDIHQDGILIPEMVIIPPGRFEMGDIWGDGNNSEKPVHTVNIHKPFAFGRYPVTFDEYDTYAQATGRKLPGVETLGQGRRPMINVTGKDVEAYVKWLSQETGKRYRLPTEAEWEYVARSGGKEEKWAGTSAEGELGDYAWYDQNSGGKTHLVGEKKPNGLGLYDMSGNVREWVQDCWHDNYEGAPDDGTAWETGDNMLRVLRGGSWSDLPRRVRSSYRGRTNRDGRYSTVGFRLAQDL